MAERLAASAERVADLLAAGDTCGAAHAADDLQDAVVEEVNARRVPPPFQEELGAVAAELVNAVNCPPAVPEDEAEADDDESGRGGGKKKDKDKKGDDG